ncbi:3736_t:CDS:2 [Ambispora gerdemannii]|uniref:3736_t:CDS:1 n=1 Tax=Ambispora gerdemannii TaxID=144530 RepID=A0A9N9GCT7_9GLOM|nr:3736_t:CDS:2 [Ambispora gerdemannii]
MGPTLKQQSAHHTHSACIDESLQNLRQLYTNIASLNLPSQWDTVDTSHLHCRIGNSQQFGLTDELAFTHFWKAFGDNINEYDKQIQLVLYRESSASASSPQQIHAFESTSAIPSGKQFVIQSIDETFEYISDYLVKEVITQADLFVTLEDVGPIDFDYFISLDYRN